MDTLPRYELIIPACGNSKRFADEGFKGSKGKILINFKEKRAMMFEHILDHAGKNCSKTTMLVQPKEEYPKIPCILHAVQTFPGQADTVAAMMKNTSGPVVVMNVDQGIDFPMDTFVASMSGANCGVVTTSGYKYIHRAAQKFSYINSYPNFTECREEEPFYSPDELHTAHEHAIVGMFYFRNKDVYLEAYEKIKRIKEERYITHVMNHIENKRAVWMSPYGLHAWGTPLQLAESQGKTVAQLRSHHNARHQS